MAKILVLLGRLKNRIFIILLKLIDFVTDRDLAIRYKMKRWGYDTDEYYFDKSQVGFIHIPKTGGTTLKSLVSGNKLFTEIHRPISKHCPPGAFDYLTIIRDPIDRVWSLYQMTLSHPDGHHYRKFAKRGLAVFLNKYWAANNLYCRYFSGRVFINPGLEELNISLENLKKFDEVLLFDHLEQELKRVAIKYELSIENIPNKRRSNNRTPSFQEKDLIMQHNKYDVELYHQYLQFRNNKID